MSSFRFAAAVAIVALCTSCNRPWPRWTIAHSERAGNVRAVYVLIPRGDAFWSSLESKGPAAIAGLLGTYYARTGILRLLACDEPQALEQLSSSARPRPDPAPSPIDRALEIWASPDGVYAHWRVPGSALKQEWSMGVNPRAIGSGVVQTLAMFGESRGWWVGVQSFDRWTLHQAEQARRELAQRFGVSAVGLTVRVWPDTDFGGHARFDPFSTPFPVNIDTYWRTPVLRCLDTCFASSRFDDAHMGRALIEQMLRAREAQGQTLLVNIPGGFRWLPSSSSSSSSR